MGDFWDSIGNVKGKYLIKYIKKKRLLSDTCDPSTQEAEVGEVLQV